MSVVGAGREGTAGPLASLLLWFPQMTVVHMLLLRIVTASAPPFLQRSYPLYARHPLWRRVIGEEAAGAALKAQVHRSEARAAAAAEGGSPWPAAGTSTLGKQSSYLGDSPGVQLSRLG